MVDRIGQKPAVKRHKMVRWYNPPLLLQAAIRAVVTTAIGSISDNREVHAARNPQRGGSDFGVYDFANTQKGGTAESGDGDEGFWFDYVADTGDGWEPTFAIAEALMAPAIDLNSQRLPRGDILIMGGDQVYPDAYNQGYEERLIAPYKEAAKAVTPFEAQVFAIPGNHDWYDGLKGFLSLFASAGRSYRGGKEQPLGHWSSAQTHSYFALHLPHNYWVWGVDVQLDGRLNPSQLDYFENISQNLMQDGDQIILCADRPYWATDDVQREDPNLNILHDMAQRKGGKIAAIIVGDIHHYSHYQTVDDAPHLITCGGGGAFLHPTHKLPKKTQLLRNGEKPASYMLGDVSPTASQSRRLSYRNLLFPFINWDFAIFIGLIYALLAWLLDTGTVEDGMSLPRAFHEFLIGNGSFGHVIERSGRMMVESPIFTLAVFLFAGALTAFNVSSRNLEKYLLGISHSLLQLFTFLAVYCLAFEIISFLSSTVQLNIYSSAPLLFLIFPLGGLAGGFAFGLFLIVSLNVFGRQWTNAFSSIRVADHKSFLRMHIDKHGRLTLFPLSIRRTGRNKSSPELIGRPIIIE